MTTSTLRLAASASVLTLRPLFAILYRSSRGLCGLLADFNRYIDAAHRVPNAHLPAERDRHFP